MGALLAASMPRTRHEDELMGRAADDMRERISEAGREQLQKVSDAVSDVRDERSRSDGDAWPSAGDKTNG